MADMLEGRPCCSIVLFTHKALLLLGVWSHALEALGCEHQYGRERDSVVLSPGPISETLRKAAWKFNQINIADISSDVTEHQFSGRVSLNTTNYSLTIRELRSTDSGDFTFTSGGEKGQRPTICIRLRVHEVLTEQPTVTFINSTQTSNESCVVVTECRYHRNVSYRWTVNNVKINGSILQYQLKPHEGGTTFTCTVSNMVSAVSNSSSFNCPSAPEKKLKEFLIMVGIACAILISIVALVILAVFLKKAKAAEANDELTVYAEIDDVPNSKIMKPCSVYETLEDQATTAKPKAQTVYDQIQFSRMQPTQNRTNAPRTNRPST